MYRPDWETDGRDWPLRANSRFVDAGRHQWHVQQFGKGPPLLLLHGTAASTHSWAPIAPFLCERFALTIVDLPGHGFTSSPSAYRPTIEHVAADIAALMRHIDVAPAMIVGHSAGAAIAAEISLSGQCRPKILIGINAALKPFPGPARFLFPVMAKALLLNPFAPYIFSGGARAPGRVRRLIGQTGSKISEDGLAQYTLLMRRPGHVAGALAMMANWDLAALERRIGAVETPFYLLAAQKRHSCAAARFARHCGAPCGWSLSLNSGCRASGPRRSAATDRANHRTYCVR